MTSRLKNRYDAGQRLAEQLQNFDHKAHAVVLALPRGGVPVAYPIAQALGLPLDVLIVRKLGVPGHSELAMGALASNGICVLNREVIDSHNVSLARINEVKAREQLELERREKLYRAGQPPLQLQHRWVILVDDGLATGASMRAAIALVKSQHPAGVVVAVPVASAEVLEEIRRDVDSVVCPLVPTSLRAIGQWYSDFSQTSDEEVLSLLARAAKRD